MEIKARELQAVRIFQQLGAAIARRDWKAVSDFAAKLAEIAARIAGKES